MTASVDRAVADARALGVRAESTMGFIHYAAMAAHRAQDPAVMCNILGCPDTLRWWHIGEFDYTAGHIDSAVYAGLVAGHEPGEG
ncbi:hypothetical protein [Microbispora sp. KK1-11]|uniref:hypothetical protein n=1 Tax=Microbispora sp. KK1-11 TaxID=2053005 RepID=UPI001158D8E4|nr:hypothetical protein [Microbispora sp. KK1-11]TQS30027.1 hypothetical protein FLW16_06615 [Microbispora sp. KK1-11]